MEIAKVAEQAAVTAQTAPKTSVQTSTEKAKAPSLPITPTNM